MSEPSLRFVVEHVRGKMRISRTEYILGRNSRSESRDCRGCSDGSPNQPNGMQFQFGPLRAMIQNRDLQHTFHLDLESRVYTAWRLNENGGSISTAPQGRALQPSGRTLNVQTETIDTGERQELFGYKARRMIIRTTHRFTAENNRHPVETEVDGWYIDPPAAWLAIHPPTPGRAILQVAVNGQVDTPVFTDIGPRESGFPLLIKRTCRSSFRDVEGNMRIHTSEDLEEVTGFSEATLDSGLFVPPRGFRRVSHLPGGRPVPFALRLRVGWENLKDRFAKTAR